MPFWRVCPCREPHMRWPSGWHDRPSVLSDKLLGKATTMMGKKERNFAPLINVSLEDLVPVDHFYRHLEKSLDLSFVREFVHETYAGKGRPSIDPVVFFKLQLVMFFEDIRSERLLMRHAADRLSVLWYLGYDLGEPLPDHSSLTRIRERYGVDIFRRFFEQIVEQCQQAGLVWGKELYFDGTKVAANASLDSVKPRFAVEAHLANLFNAESERLPEERDQQIPQEDAPSSDPVEQEKLPAPRPLPTSLSQEEREALAQHNAGQHDWIEQLGAQDRQSSSRGYQRMADLRVSTTDRDATLMLTNLIMMRRTLPSWISFFSVVTRCSPMSCTSSRVVLGSVWVIILFLLCGSAPCTRSGAGAPLRVHFYRKTCASQIGLKS